MIMSPSCRSCGSSESDGGNCQLLHEVKALGRALHLRQPFPRGPPVSSVETPLSRKSGILRKGTVLEPGADAGKGGDSSKSGKSRSVWSWKKPLKALSRIRDRQFPCFFFLHVHSIEGLPASFDESSLCVEFVRKDEALRTRPSRVTGGIVNFDDTLMHRCTVYCHKMNDAYNSCKYEPKLFFVRAYVNEASVIDLGKHRVDLTRLLPVSFDELDGDKSSGKWTTCFKLTREATGGVLNVSFGFSLGYRSVLESSGDLTVSELISMSYSGSSTKRYNAGSQTDGGKPFGGLRRSGSVPGRLKPLPGFLPDSTDAKRCYKALVNPSFELSKSIHFVYQKLDEDRSTRRFNLLMEDVDPVKEKDNSSVDTIETNGNDACVEMEYVVIDRGIEVAEKEEPDLVQGDVSSGPGMEGLDLDEIVTSLGLGHEEEILNVDQGIDLNTVDSDVLLACEGENSDECHGEVMTKYRANRIGKKSPSLDLGSADKQRGVDFLDVHGNKRSSVGGSLDQDPESPRERLLREFQEEALASGNFVISFDSAGEEESESDCRDLVLSDSWADSEDSIIASAVESSQNQLDVSSWSLKLRIKLDMPDDLETEAIQNSRQCDPSSFGNPVESFEAHTLL